MTTTHGFPLPLAIVALLALAPGAATAQDAPSPELLQRVAETLNRGTPLMIDEDTQLASVGAEPGAIVYHNRLVRVALSAIPVDRLEALARPAVIERACTHPRTRQDLLDRGITMRYEYVDKDGQFVMAFDVTAADCPTQ
jgi:hypothetical protein